MLTEKRICENWSPNGSCNNEFEARVGECNGRLRGESICPECAKRYAEEKSDNDIIASIENRRKREIDEFDRICPPLYLKTDITRLPKNQFEEMSRWKYSPIGLGAIGKTGTCKTRCMWQVLRKNCGFDIIITSATSFAHECSLLYSSNLEEAEKWVKRLCLCEILFIDDIGKDRSTERVATELYFVVEQRTANEKPILWTSNFVGKNLEEKLGESGAATVRRLREFSKIVSFA